MSDDTRLDDWRLGVGHAITAIERVRNHPCIRRQDTATVLEHLVLGLRLLSASAVIDTNGEIRRERITERLEGQE